MGILLKGIAKRLVKSLVQPKVQYNNCIIVNDNKQLIIIVLLVLIMLHSY